MDGSIATMQRRWELGVRVHFLSFFDTSGQAAPRIVASSYKDAGNTEDHDAVDNLSWGQ